MENKLLVMPIPNSVKQDTHVKLQVRSLGDEEWTDVPLFAVRVDMHQVRQAAAAMFDFSGSVEVRIQSREPWVYKAVVRPVSKGIVPVCEGREVRFTLHEPVDLMIEINGERFRCLHLFARPLMTLPEGDDVVHYRASMHSPSTAPARPPRREDGKPCTVVFHAGLHFVHDYQYRPDSNTRIVLAPGAVVIGMFILDHVENVSIEGHGVLLQECFHRFAGTGGVRLSYCRNVSVQGVTFINPPQFTVLLGSSEHVRIEGIRTFSCEGWSDGIAMMGSHHVHVSDCFLRNSDDCLSLYGQRGEYIGDAHDIRIERCTLWADVAHPFNMGTHGAYDKDGSILERIILRDIDILEHHEPQPGYLGCMAINAGDMNTVRDVLFEDIRVEHIENGKLFDIQVTYNPKYNPVPGRKIENVTLRNISCDCIPPVDSVIQGYDEEHGVTGVKLENVTVCGNAPRVVVGEFTREIDLGGAVPC